MALAPALISMMPQAFDLVDKLFVTEDDRQSAKLKVLELAQRGELAQVEVNKAEAQHRSLFVAGWRPFIGWVCGLAFAWQYFLMPMVYFILSASGVVFVLPTIPMESMITVLMGMLGLGALRTFEKREGVANDTPLGGPDKLGGALQRAINTPVDRSGKR